MMVDPDVHFHVIPRYAQVQSFEGQEFHDYGWSGPPDFKQVNPTVSEMNRKILSTFKTFGSGKGRSRWIPGGPMGA